jgi:signal transduction histidine kinase
MVDDFARLNNNKISLFIEDINHLISHDSQIIIYRIFQEALTNIGKHAGADHVSVSAKQLDGKVAFVVEDDGNGFDKNQLLLKNPSEKSLGLAAIDERARMLDASLDIWSQVGRGTRISFTVPINASTK